MGALRCSIVQADCRNGRRVGGSGWALCGRVGGGGGGGLLTVRDLVVHSCCCHPCAVVGAWRGPFSPAPSAAHPSGLSRDRLLPALSVATAVALPLPLSPLPLYRQRFHLCRFHRCCFRDPAACWRSRPTVLSRKRSRFMAFPAISWRSRRIRHSEKWPPVGVQGAKSALQPELAATFRQSLLSGTAETGPDAHFHSLMRRSLSSSHRLPAAMGRGWAGWG